MTILRFQTDLPPQASTPSTPRATSSSPRRGSTRSPPPDKFDIEAEVAWIDQMCAEGKVVAIGECGLDAYYCTDEESLEEQERVLRLLIEGEYM